MSGRRRTPLPCEEENCNGKMEQRLVHDFLVLVCARCGVTRPACVGARLEQPAPTAGGRRTA